ncbi:MAG TPA: helix-turn-helix transcriptional regulator [Solirubrobacterales bacterium]|nr:helix-turn-helix transcriptional regulator [Solirubrobacterales bacterium]
MPPRRESTPLSLRHAAFGEAVRQLRERRNWSQEDLSDEADVHISQISGIERGTSNTTIRTLGRVADGLQTGLGEIWTLADRLGEEGAVG